MTSRSLARLILLGLAAVAVAAPVAGQVPGCIPLLDGPRLPAPPSPALRKQSELLLACDSMTVGFAPTPVLFRSTFRSAYPYDRNDGVLWGGKGLSAAISGGGAYTVGPLRVVVHPELSFQQNRPFELAGDSGFAYPDPRIDFPQRFGEGAFWEASPGQSSLSLAVGPLEAALATESLWWGPARRYPLLLGNSAPGFPHLRIGISDTWDVGIGRLAVDLLWGRLDESRYFDDVRGNDHRLLTGVFVELSLLDGLSLGLAGVQHNRWSRRSSSLLDIFTFPFEEGVNSAGNGLLSLTGRWHLEESEMSVYTEWAREDYWEGLGELIAETDHSQAYTFGFEKVVREARVPLRIRGELAHLGTSATRLSRADRTPQGVTFYQHSTIRQGHTHKGQLLGAAIGPGSDAQYVAVEMLLEGRTLGTYFERVRRDEDTYYWRFAEDYRTEGHDVEVTGGLMGEEHAGALALRWNASLSHRRNRSFIGLDGQNRDFLEETNLELGVTACWVPGLP